MPVDRTQLPCHALDGGGNEIIHAHASDTINGQGNAFAGMLCKQACSLLYEAAHVVMYS